MKYCARCLQPDTRPNTVFTDDGVCPACNYHEQAMRIDWQERYELLTDLVRGLERSPGQFFDCIIGVSGGKDSTRQALFVRDKLGLKPLLVSLSHPPQQVSQLGVDNISNLIELGFDVLFSSPAPETWSKLMRESFYRFSNWARSSELALFTSVPQIAIRYQIPTIFWGENPALQVGDMSTMGRNGWDGNNLRYSNTLSTGHAWMLEAGFTPQELIPYTYPSVEEFDAAGIQIIYLGWFLGDWSLLRNASYACSTGLHIRPEAPLEQGDLYGISNLDEDWHNMNQMIKYYKFGFGKVTEYVNEELRSGELSREKAIELVKKFDGKCHDRYITSFCDFIDISVDSFWSHVLRSVNRTLFDVTIDGRIQPKFEVGVGL